MLLSLFVFLSINANAATYTVTKIADTKSKSIAETLADKSDCELREAVRAANSTPEDDVIEFDPNVFGEKQTIVLDGSLRIEGGTKGSLTINGNGVTVTAPNASVFIVNPGETLTLTGVNVTGGSADVGGGIYNNRGTVTLINSAVFGNSAGSGGGIYNLRFFNAGGMLTVNNSTISGNTSPSGFGGGIANNRGTVTVNNSTISGNSTTLGGGGISTSNGMLTVNNSTISGNFTVQGNGRGGGIYSAFDITNITNSTIAFNTSSNGGGIYIESGFFGVVKAGNSIFGNNFGATGVDVFGTLTSQGYNLIGNTSLTNINGDTTGNILNRLIQFGPLQNNGGSTFTHAPFSNSPALNAGSNLLALDSTGQPLTNDQRGAGFPRIINSRVDIGAFESSLIPSLDFVVDNTSDDGSISGCTVAGNDCSLRGAIAAANATAGNETITFDAGIFAAPQTITLTNGNLSVNSGSITINAINGLRISGNNASRIFIIAADTTLNLNNLTLTNGFQGGDGGAIFSQGTLNITNSNISTNRSTERGGGIFNFAGTVNLVNSTLSGNFLNAVSQGGGITIFRERSIRSIRPLLTTLRATAAAFTATALSI